MRHKVLLYADALDVAAEGAVWYARRIFDGRFEALHVAGRGTDSGIHARWFDYTGGEPRLDVRPPGADPIAAVLGEIARLREGPDDVVTVVLPEQFRRRSLLAAASRAQFRLKLRLLTEPDVVVSDVPAVTEGRRPEGRVPDRLAVRVVAGARDDATERAQAYARDLGVPDLEELDARGLEPILAAVRALTAEPGTVVNVVLPERIHPSLRLLRSRPALAIKRALLFEPHVILTSVPHRP